MPACPPVVQQAPPPTAPSTSVLLAVSPVLPRQMQRAVWSLADYDITRRIFKGAMSSVYQATCRRSGLPVALKIYFLTRVPANATHMVAREITIHSNLVHKNIITLYGAFQEEGQLVLVQEFAARGDLHHIYRSLGRRMTEDQVRQVVLIPFLEALTHLHSKGICHRDVKPENLMFGSDWRLKVGDFGVSINLAEERAVTRAGTLDYMAPEVERCPIKYMPHDNKNNPYLAYTTAVDIWAVGVLAYELLVGFPPFIIDPNNPGAGRMRARVVPPMDADAGPAACAGAPADATAAAPAGGAAFRVATATRDSLSFPTSLAAGARDFITAALAEQPEDRPTAAALLHHPWIRRVVQTQPAPSRGSSLSSGGSQRIHPQQLASALGSGSVHAQSPGAPADPASSPYGTHPDRSYGQPMFHSGAV